VTIEIRGEDVSDVALEIRRLSFEPVRPSDYDFAHDLTRNNMAEFVTRHWGGWDSAIFRKNFEQTENYLVYCCSDPAGFVRLAVDGAQLVLDDLQIVPEFQNQGIGTWVLRQIQSIAIQRNLRSVRLRCFHDNPAYNLYRRVGFHVVIAGETADWLELPIVLPKEASCDSAT